MSSHRVSSDVRKSIPMEIDTTKAEQERSTRAASVLSGMSIEDMEAAETLNSLQQSKYLMGQARVTSADY